MTQPEKSARCARILLAGTGRHSNVRSYFIEPAFLNLYSLPSFNSDGKSSSLNKAYISGYEYFIDGGDYRIKRIPKKLRTKR